MENAPLNLTLPSFDIGFEAKCNEELDGEMQRPMPTSQETVPFPSAAASPDKEFRAVNTILRDPKEEEAR